MPRTHPDSESDDPADATPAHATPPLHVDAPDTSPNDEPIRVRVTGATPGAPVTLTATLTDDDGATWRSETTFTANAAGVVDCTRHAPTDGPAGYDDVRPMGWLWTMRTDADADADAAFPAFGDTRCRTVDLAAETPSRHATRTITRRHWAAGVTRHDVATNDLAGALYTPADDGPHPGVLVLHGSDGRTPERTCRLLATRGYATFAVQYFGDADPIPDDHRRVPLEYFARAANWLRARPDVRDGPVGVVGGSRGGELALLLGARFDWVAAVVAYAASGVAWDTPSDEPAWTHDGDPVPHLDGKDIPRETVAAGLDDEPVDAAAFAVEHTDGPILALTGGDDQLWQAERLTNVAIDRLDRHDFPHDYDHRVYEDAGHLIGVPYAPLTGVGRVGGTPSGTARAAADSWPRVLATLAQGLDAPTEPTPQPPMHSFTDPTELTTRTDVDAVENPLESHQSHYDVYEPIAGMAIVGVTDDDGDTLLMVRDDGPHYVLPHTEVAHGDDWAAAARRAVTEQTGLTVELDGVERVRTKHYQPEPPAEDATGDANDRPTTTGHDVVFSATPTPDAALDDDAHAIHDDNWTVDWHDELPRDPDQDADNDVLADVRLFVD